MLHDFFRQLSLLILSVSFVCGPIAAAVGPDADRPLKAFLETNLPDIDSTRLVLNVADLTYSGLSRLTGAHADILPGPDQNLNVFVFVPADLSPFEQDLFLRDIRAEMSKSNPRAQLQVVGVELDSAAAERDAESANAALEQTAAEIQRQSGDDVGQVKNSMIRWNKRKVAELREWARGFPDRMRGYRAWIASGYTKELDEHIGGVIGSARGVGSVFVWFKANGPTVPTFFQAPASFVLDWFFSKYEKHIDRFKGLHRLPGENIPVLRYAVRFYNDRPLLKSWVVGNLIGFVIGNYFRFWSWVADPQRTSAPWSVDALSTYGTLWAIGNAAGATGAVGPRVIRKKGYINSRIEYYIYSSYRALFQIGGFLYGLGLDHIAVAYTTSETALKVGVYGLGRYLPLKDPRALVFHPSLTDRQVDELLYRAGFDAKEALRPDDEQDFAERIRRLKVAQTDTWKKRVTDLWSRARSSCENLLR